MKTIYHLLIASSEAKDRKQLEAFFASQPYELSFASSRAEAVQNAGQSGVDLYILDASSDDIGAFELTRKLKADPKTRPLPIVLICPPENESRRSKGIDAGCDDFISKPFDRIEVQTRIETILKLNYARSVLEGQAKFDSLFDYMEDGIVLLDNELKITRINEKAKGLLEIKELKEGVYFPERLLRLYKVNSDGDLGPAMRERSLRFDAERPETENTRPLILEVRTNVIQSAFRDISGIIVTLDDVTEVRNKAFKEEQFLNFISHKLQTPLAIVNKNATLFHKNVVGPLTDDQKTLMNAIYEKSSELVESFDKLIQFMAIKNRKADLFNEWISFDPVVLEQMNAVVRKEKKKKVGLQVVCGDKETKVFFDKKHLGLIFQNLIENAIKFCDKESVEIVIQVKKKPDNSVEVVVEDNGSGIPPEERDNIFRPFYQVDKNRTGNVRGTGLGLAIVQYLAAAHGADIRLQSEPGKKTSFALTFNPPS